MNEPNQPERRDAAGGLASSLRQTLAPLWPPNLVRAILKSLLMAHLAAEISRLDWHIEIEERRISEWAHREEVWRTERARLATKLDRLRGIGDRVKFLHRIRGSGE